MYGLQIVCIDCGEPVEAGKNRCAMHLRRTSDRAVVENIYDTETGALLGSRVPPRALCAVSEDRQWLVVLGLDGEFVVQEWDEGDDEYRANYVSVKGVPDTGQDAHAVLEQFLKEHAHA